MTKQEKRIAALEKEVKELREQLLQLAMRPQYIYTITQPTVNPTLYQPWAYTYTATCDVSRANTTWAGVATMDV